jgi:hypothetical protein
MREFTFPVAYMAGKRTRIGFGTVPVPEVAEADALPVLEHERVVYRGHGGRLWMPSGSWRRGRLTASGFEAAVAAWRADPVSGRLGHVHANPFAEVPPRRPTDLLDSGAGEPYPQVDDAPMSPALRRSREWADVLARASRTVLVGDTFHETTTGPVLNVYRHRHGVEWYWLGGQNPEDRSGYLEQSFGYRQTGEALALFGPPVKVNGTAPRVFRAFDDGYDHFAVYVESAAFHLLRKVRTHHLRDLDPATLRAVATVRRELERRLPGHVLNYASPELGGCRHVSEVAPDASGLVPMVDHFSRLLGPYGAAHVVEPMLRRQALRTPAPDADNEAALASVFP